MAQEFTNLFVGGGENPREGKGRPTKEEKLRIGDLCLSIGSLNDAISYYRTALEGEEISPEDRVNVALRIVECLKRKGNVKEALDFIESVVGDLSAEGSSLLAEKARLYLLLGRYDDAHKMCQDALRIQAKSVRQDVRLFLVLGHILARMCRWNEAVTTFEHAACLSATCGDQVSLGKAFNNLGIIYKNLCKLDDSARFLEKAAEINRRLENKAGLAHCLLNTAITLYKKGDLLRAKAAIDECINLSSIVNLVRIRVLGLICKARIQGLRGDLRKALKTVCSVLDSFDWSNDPRAHLVAQEVYSEILIEKGEIKTAKAILEKVMDEIPCDAGDLRIEAMVRLAIVYQRLRNLSMAIELAEKARGLARDLGDRFEEARALRVIGMCVSDCYRSRELLIEAASIFESIGAKLELAITKHMLGLRDLSQIDCLRQALSLYRDCGARRFRVIGLCDLSRYYVREGYRERAINCLEEASTLCEDDEVDLITRVRREIDSEIARSLLMTCKVPSDETCDLGGIKQALDADAIAIARLEGQNMRIVDLAGISPNSVEALIKGIREVSSDPVISTDPSIFAPQDQFVRNLGLLVAKKLRVDEIDYLIVALWKRSRIGGAHTHISLALRTVSATAQIETCIRRFHRRSETGFALCFGGLVTTDTHLRSILLSIPKMARSSANVLITGETGTGKELVARAIHLFSDRSEKPFVALNCAALPEHLLESELFGHRAGSFTGAKENKPGLIEIANGGTFFLDEVGELSLAMQAKILRTIETNEIRRVGETQARHIDTRFISATNKDLESEVERGAFRKDLYYRLDVVSIHLPPLRERRGDIPILANLFMRRFASRMRKRIAGFSDEAIQAMINYDWPGNVRQLENEVEKAVTVAEPDSVITKELLSFCKNRFSRNPVGTGLKDEIRRLERSRILAVLESCGWNKTRAARMLGDISRPALIAKMKRLGLPLSPQ